MEMNFRVPVTTTELEGEAEEGVFRLVSPPKIDGNDLQSLQRHLEGGIIILTSMYVVNLILFK